MSKKTKRHVSRKRHNTRKRHNKKRIHRYRKRRDIPGSQGIPLFTTPEKTQIQKVYVNKGKGLQSGNMILGMRDM